MRLVADIETNGYLDHTTKIHCLVVRERQGKILASCTDDPRGREMGYQPISDGLKLLSEAEKIYFHNGIGFDIPALKKIYPEWDYSGDLVDTLVVVSFRFAHIAEQDAKRAVQRRFPSHLIGMQRLEAWGHRLGVHKGEYTDWCKENGIEDAWAEWRPEMQTYCELDTEVTDALCDHIGKMGATPPMAMEIEHELARYLTQQQRNGWPFDMEKAQELHATLAARKMELADKMVEEFGWWYEKNGETTPKRTTQYKASKTREVPELVVEGAPYTKIKQVEFNPNSRQHIAKVLQERYGWRPSEYTPSGQVKVSEKVLKGLTMKVSDTLMEYLLVDKRLGLLAGGKKETGWMDYATPDGPEGGKLTGLHHIHHNCWQNNCVTHRASHSKPNAAQVPAAKSNDEGLLWGPEGKWGADCRDLWVAPPQGWVMVGADASGLELRGLGHYMAAYDDGEYGRIILEGDIHTVNRDALRGSGHLNISRDNAKTFIYAYLYGAGDAKLGSIIAPGAKVGVQKKIGAELRTAFESQIPALGKLQAKVKSKIKRGYLIMPDGRRTYIRHEHAALNSLLQADGAIICKRWIVEFNRRLMKEFDTPHGGGWNHSWAALGWIHDEAQLATRTEVAETVGKVLVESIRHMTEVFDRRVPLDGEYKTGGSWATTH